MKLKLGELYCGPGGLALGAKHASFPGCKYVIDHCWANDIDSDSCATYRHNICPHDPESIICGDVRELDISSLKSIDCFAYGFPCNDFSVVGDRKGFNGSYGPLYYYGVKVINKFKPLFFVAENVSGLSSANSGDAFKTILSDLETAGDGYNLTVHLYKSEHYGVPQTRHRIIIVGIAKKEGLIFKVPKPFSIENPISARDAIEKPPISIDAPNNEIPKLSKSVVERLNHIKPGENAWNSNLPDHLKLNVKGAKLSQIYKRLDPDKPSYTITGSGGGGTHGYHWSIPRALTNRERARLQTFPDDFIFSGGYSSVRKQIGMAVPPRLSEIIFTAILKTISGVNYETIIPSINHFHITSEQKSLNFGDIHECC